MTRKFGLNIIHNSDRVLYGQQNYYGGGDTTVRDDPTKLINFKVWVCEEQCSGLCVRADGRDERGRGEGVTGR